MIAYQGLRASRNISCRIGRVILEDTPSLSQDAKGILASDGGLNAFRVAYGDFFVCGYEIGADAGATLSATSKSTLEKEVKELEIKVKVLFWSIGYKTRSESESSSASASISFCGYNTFTNELKSIASKAQSAHDQAQIQSEAARYMQEINDLDRTVRRKLKDFGLMNGQSLPLEHCSSLCGSGIVVNLLLAPFARLNEVTRLVQ